MHIIYPSIEVAATVMSFIKGVITIHRKKYQVEYYPLKRVDLNMIYDWYCAKCEYKNYGRRNKCYRCESEMTSECKVDHSNPVGPIGSKYSKE